MKTTTRFVLLAAVVGTAAAILSKPRSPAEKLAHRLENAPGAVSLPMPPLAAPEPGTESGAGRELTTPPPKAPATSPQIAAATPPQSPLPTPGKPEARDPVARLALSDVGLDPNAEAYWFQAINDPSLPAEERKDLIEDLNETGLSDPDHPSPQDLVLIASRIEIIEQLAPYSIDQVNADAFSEAYKDLVKLYNGLPAD